MTDDERFAKMLYSARLDADISQSELARRMGIDKRTVQHWESGDSAPSFREALMLFNVCGVNPWKYFTAYVYPDLYESINPEDESQARAALIRYLNDAPADEIYILLFLFSGVHGSSPRSMLHLIAAHLHNTLQQRVGICSQEVSQYKINQQLGIDAAPEWFHPYMPILDRALSDAAEAAGSKRTGYTNQEGINNGRTGTDKTEDA